MLKQSLLTVLIFSIFAQVHSKRDYDIYFVKFDCKLNASTFFEAFVCNLERHADGKNYGNLYFSMRKPLKELPVRMMFFAYRKGKAPLKGYDISFDVCTVFNTASKQPLFNIFLKNMRTYFVELPTCPMKTHFNYTIKNYIQNPDNYPENIPAGKFGTKIIAYENKKAVVEIDVETKVVHKEKKMRS